MEKEKLMLVPAPQPQFYQPLLPGFRNHLSIPIAFMKHIRGQGRRPRQAVLKSAGCERSWRVRMDGRRFTNGWKEFARSHCLRLGDVLVFRYERDLVFHVVILDANGCERLHEPSHIAVKDDDDDVDDDDDDDDCDDGEICNNIEAGNLVTVKLVRKGDESVLEFVSGNCSGTDSET